MEFETISLEELEVLEETVAPCGSIACGGGNWC
jgi:hypothetical protein